MKVSLNWLTDYVDISMSAAELGELLTRIGFSLEEIIETQTDVVLDLEVTSNRPDCLGHLGIAREIAAATGAKFKRPVIGELPTSGKVAELASVEVLDPDLCPRYTARVIRGLKVKPSPKWMIERLEAVGLHGINNIVDVTNYVLMEYSQPLHCFDHDKLTRQKIIVRRGKAGETLLSIDDTTCRLDEEMLVIADAKKPIAIAGVMGGLDTEVTEQTTSVLMEAAQFDPLVTRHTSRKLQLTSESNYRFERGVDPVAVSEASLRACQLILQLAGGQLAEGVLDIWAEPWQPRTVRLRPGRCNALLGIETPTERQVEILSSLSLAPKLKGQQIVCTIPSHRIDLQREADLIEEVARMEGYERIPVAEKIAHSVASEGPTRRTRRMVEEAMTAAGFDEALTSSFADAAEAELFGWGRSCRVDSGVRKTNNVLRAAIVPSLLRACKTNQDAGTAEVSLFELASVFPAGEDARLPAEHMELGMVSTGDLRDVRGAIAAVLGRVAPSARLDARHCHAVGFAEGAAAEVFIDDQRAGTIGLIADNVLDYYGLNPDRPIAAASVRFDALGERAGRPRIYQAMAKFPAVHRDLSVVVDEKITWRQLAESIAEVEQPTRVDLGYVTTYRGRQISPGRKSVTLTLTYRSGDRTLKSEQVDQQVAEVVTVLKKKFAAELRR